MDQLIEGYRRFRETAWREHRTRFERLAAHGQSPRALVITCSDSRLDPQMIFSTAPGEIFVVRNVAGLVPPHTPNADYHGTSAAIEFAVRMLPVRDIVVLGHAQCGGIAALLQDTIAEQSDFIGSWMALARPARERALAAAKSRPEAVQHLCEHEAIKLSLANLLTFPWLRERVEAGALALHGCYFGIAAGELLRLDASGAFRPV